MKNIFIWLQREEGWKTLLALVYAIICIFDFIIVPIFFGITKRDILTAFEGSHLETMDVSIQLELIKSFTAQHSPFTLQGGGIFHLAFGALLTGSAITSKLKEST